MLSFTAFWGSSPSDGCCSDDCHGDASGAPEDEEPIPVIRSTTGCPGDDVVVVVVMEMRLGEELEVLGGVGDRLF